MNYNYNITKKYMDKLETQIKELQQRIDKAIEYIKKNTNIYKCEDETICMFDDINASPKELLDILKGKDE